MIIFGTKTTTKRLGGGEFHCPHCATRRPYALKRLKRWFHLYWIPTIPMGELSRWVECQACGSQYTEAVLAYDPEAQARAFEAAFFAAARDVLVRAALAGGAPDPRVLSALAQALGNLTRADVQAGALAGEVEAARHAARAAIADVLRPLAGSLSEPAREALVRSAAYVAAAATGTLSAEAEALLGEVSRAIDMSSAHLRGVVAETLRPAA